MIDIHSRVIKIIELYGMTVGGFERKCGVSNGAIYAPLKHIPRKFSDHTIRSIEYYTLFNYNWIMDGSGVPFKDNLTFQENILKILFEENSNIKLFEKIAGFTPKSYKRMLNPKTEYPTIYEWGKALKQLYPNHDYSWLYRDLDISTKQNLQSVAVKQNLSSTTDYNTGNNVKKNFFLPDKMLKSIDLLAYAEKTTPGKIIAKAIGEYLNKPENIAKIQEGVEKKLKEIQDFLE